MKSDNNNNSYLDSLNKYNISFFYYLIVFAVIFIVLVILSTNVLTKNDSDTAIKDDIKRHNTISENDINSKNQINEKSSNTDDQIESDVDISVNDNKEPNDTPDKKVKIILNEDNEKITTFMSKHNMSNSMSYDNINSAIESNDLDTTKKLILDYINDTGYNYILESSDDNDNGSLLIELENIYYLITFDVFFKDNYTSNSQITEIDQITVEVFELNQNNNNFDINEQYLTNSVINVDEQYTQIENIVTNNFDKGNKFNLKIYTTNNNIYLDILNYELNELNIFKIGSF